MITLNLTAEQVDALMTAAFREQERILGDIHFRETDNRKARQDAHIERLRRRRSILIDAIAAVSNQRRRKAPGGGK